MGLRDEWESDDTNNANEECRVWKWLGEFAADDRAFVLSQMGARHVPTEAFLKWLKRKGQPPVDVSRMNDHRRRRCTCPDEYGGRIA